MIELLSVLSIAGLALFLFLYYDDLRVETVRQQMFALRDELFDEARAGKISFDSQAYAATRAVMNGMIRFSHRVSFSRMLTFRLIYRDRDIRFFTEPFDQAMKASSASDRELCGRYVMRANVLMMKHVLSSPLVIMFVFPPVIGILLSKAGFDIAGRTVKACKAQFAEFDGFAFREGSA